MRLASNADRLLLIAAREPVAGATKTRLGATIGMDAAAALHRAFLRDLAARFSPRDPAFRLGWAFSPPECDFRRVIAQLGGTDAIDGPLFVPQEGHDWAIRQVNLLGWGYRHGFRKTVLISSDSPQVSGPTIAAAFGALERADLVLGPVFDGGYYLIGVREPHDVLSGITMSTGEVFTAVRARAEGLGLRVAEVAATFDVDVQSDLQHLIALLRDDPAAAPHTLSALRELGLVSAAAMAAGDTVAAAV